MFDAHAHIRLPDTIFCTSDLIFPYFLKGNYFLQAQGIIPENLTNENWELKSKSLESIIQQEKKLQIGEVGLDKRFLEKIDLENQISFFMQCLNLAIKYNRGLFIHCVRYKGLMVEILTKYQNQLKTGELRVLWHGFDGSIEMATQLAKFKVVLSLKPGFRFDIARFWKEKAYKENIITLETDYVETGASFDEKLYSKILENHYERVSLLLNQSINQCNKWSKNAGKIFKN